ncbi:MAG: hypothetical protein ACR2NN_11815 [Bryobacteraceae bacterium]
MRKKTFLYTAALLFGAAQLIHAQQSILGTNLIFNGNAEAGPAGTTTTAASSIPGWIRTGNPNVLPYDLTGHILLSDPAPPDHGFQYFTGGVGSSNAVSTLMQPIDVSSGASIITGGNVKYTASAYLGSAAYPTLAAQVNVAFQNANGQTFSNATLGPLSYPGSGMSLQQQIGLVPSNTVRITVTLTLNGQSAAADSLSLVLSTLGTSAGSVLGTNLVVNGNAEAGPGTPHTSTTLYVPGWSTTNGASVAPYGGTGWIAISDPGPADRGVNLFCGGRTGADSYQDIDVSAAAALIDSGQVTYQVSAWLGELAGAGQDIPIFTYTFFDWPGKQLAPTGQLGATSPSRTALVETSHAGTLPFGTRRVHIALRFLNSAALADDIAFVLSAPGGPPVITPGGIVSAGAFGGFASAAPGSWIEIYGTNLASATQGWSGADFINAVAPTSLGGVSVSVGGQAAFVDYVSAGQVNALVPSNAPVGPSVITLTNSNGTSDPFSIYVKQTEPGLLAPAAFQIGGKQYAAALFPDGQTFAIPPGAISGVASRPAKVGETLTIYGIGFGPVTGGFTAGTIVDQQNSLTVPLQFFFGTTPATLNYYGLAPNYTGLYQFNVIVPNVAANNAYPVSISLGGTKGSQTLYVAVQN